MKLLFSLLIKYVTAINVFIKSGRSNGDMHVLHDVFAALDAIYHTNLWCILEICRKLWKCSKTKYVIFFYITQRMQIDHVLFDLANIICGVPQSSVLKV